MIKRFRRDTNEEPPIKQKHDCVDWDSDDEGVLKGQMHYESDAVHLEHQFEEVDLDLHVNSREIDLIATDDSTDEWRSVVVTLDADAAAELAEQLQVAAKYARDGKNADVRI